VKRNQVEAEFAATARKGRILCRAKVAGPRDRAEDSSAAISILNLFVQDRDTRSSYCVWKRGGNHTTTTWDSLEIPTPPDSHWGESESGSGGHGGMGKGGRAEARHEALPHTSPGGKPPETPGPLSVRIDFREPIGAVKGSQAVHSHALDSSDRFPTPSLYDGKGA